MRADLQRLKRDTDSSRNIPAADAHVSTGAAQPTHASGSSAVVTVAKQHKLELGITSAVVILLILAAAYGIYSFLSRTRPAPFQNFSVSKVTETGKATLVAISPDGKYLLHVMDDNGQQSLWLRNVPTNSNAQVVAPGPVRYLGVRFSPDGNYLYFVRSEAGNSALKYLYRAPVLGGTPQKLVTDIDSSISFSPDGTKFVYLLANNPTVGEYRVIIRTLEGGAERTLATAPLRELVANAAWSPDGKTIVTPVSQPGDQLSALAALDVESGKRNLFVSRTTCISHGRSGCRMAAGCWLWVRTPSPTSRRLFLFLFLRARCRRSRATPTRIPISVWPPMAAPSPPSSSRPIRIPT